MIDKKTIPRHPGCYIMKNAAGEIIYIGKAKDLSKRVKSYWYSKDDKTQRLVADIDDIEFILTDNEVEALILESQLIYKHHPKYNIDLKASQRYAFIKISDEKFPRLQLARKVGKSGKYFGPYPSGAARSAAHKAANRIFKLRNCKHIPKQACLRYHMDHCSGPCINMITEEEYKKNIKDVEKFLKGEYKTLIEDMRTLMIQTAEKQEFEKAKFYRDQFLALSKLEEQKMSAPKDYNQDAMNFIVIDNKIIIQIFNFNKGIISGRKEYTFDLDKVITDNPQYDIQFALQKFIQQYYSSFDVPKEIIIPVDLPEKDIISDYLEKVSGHKVDLLVPVQGTKFKLLEMLKKNLLLKAGNTALQELKEVLNLPTVPNVIACIDISTLSGTNSVGSLVQFVNGQPYKSGYRKFKIKEVEGINDYAMLSEIIGRFFKRVLAGQENKPDLLVVDGGPGQLSSVTETLMNMGIEIPSIGLAKRLEEIYFKWDPHPLRLPASNEGLKLLRAIRDEAHRFAVTYQRYRRKQK